MVASKTVKVDADNVIIADTLVCENYKPTN